MWCGILACSSSWIAAAGFEDSAYTGHETGRATVAPDDGDQRGEIHSGNPICRVDPQRGLVQVHSLLRLALPFNVHMILCGISTRCTPVSASRMPAWTSSFLTHERVPPDQVFEGG